MSMREAIRNFRELHKEFKAGEFKSAEARKFYDSQRDDFLRTLLEAQQLGLGSGQSPRQALRVSVAASLALEIGSRRESAITLDLASAGFAAKLGGPLAIRIVCDFELGIAPAPVRGRARVVSSTRDGAGVYRTSFAIEAMPDDDRTRLEVAVVDAALDALPKR